MPNLKRGMMGAAGAGGRTTGQLFLWGSDNGVGVLGNESSAAVHVPTQLGEEIWSNIDGAGGGLDAVLAVKNDGTLWAWGGNQQGILGLGHLIYVSSPTQVGSLSNWSKVSASRSNALAIKTDGTLWSWGAGAGHGAIGDGTFISRSSPVQIGSLTTWTQIATGNQGCSMLRNDNTLWTTGEHHGTGQNDDNNFRNSPIQVDGAWSSIARGNKSVWGVRTDGSLWAWGATNQYGHLGFHPFDSVKSPTQVGSLTDWSKISAGHHQSGQSPTFAIKTNGTLWSWGRGTTGALGHGDLISRSSPVQVGSLTNWSEIAAGDQHAVAIKTDKSIWIWGQMQGGISGTGVAHVYRSSPVQMGTDTWSGIATGSNFVGALVYE